MANIWRRIPSGKLSTNRLLKKSSGAAGGLVADDFFEYTVDGVIASSQGQSSTATASLSCVSASSQAASTVATLGRTIGSQITWQMSQAEQAGGSFGATLGSSFVLSQGQTDSGTTDRTRDSQAAASQAQSSESTNGLTISASVAASEGETVEATLGRTIDSEQSSSAAETVLGTLDGAASAVDSTGSSEQTQTAAVEIVLIEKTVRWKILQLPKVEPPPEPVDCNGKTGQGQTTSAQLSLTTQSTLRSAQVFETRIRDSKLIMGCRNISEQRQYSIVAADEDNSDMELLLFLLAA